MRYFIEIAYHGKNYHGWQIQPDAVSVQEVIERTLSTLLRDDIKVTGAGRTDTGVHARQLFVHFDCGAEIDSEETVFKLNSFLPKDICVRRLFSVHDEAHARFDAIEREYEYVITLTKDPFLENTAWLVHQKPDVALMNEAAEILLTYNDFQCFSRSKTDVKTYHCTIKKAYWQEEDSLLIFTISANRFLRNMVRAIVGTLLDIGHGKTTIDDLHEIIKNKDRSNAGASAPAHGLFLTRVVYPDTITK